LDLVPIAIGSGFRTRKQSGADYSLVHLVCTGWDFRIKKNIGI